MTALSFFRDIAKWVIQETNAVGKGEGLLILVLDKNWSIETMLNQEIIQIWRAKGGFWVLTEQFEKKIRARYALNKKNQLSVLNWIRLKRQ